MPFFVLIGYVVYLIFGPKGQSVRSYNKDMAKLTRKINKMAADIAARDNEENR